MKYNAVHKTAIKINLKKKSENEMILQAWLWHLFGTGWTAIEPVAFEAECLPKAISVDVNQHQNDNLTF